MCALEMPGGKPYQQQTFANMRASTDTGEDGG
jgi:hypothetical protein